MSYEYASRSRLGRRNLLQAGALAAGGLVAAMAGLPLLGYLFSPLTKQTSEQWMPLCKVDQVRFDHPMEFKVTFQGENAHRDYGVVRGVFAIRRDDQILTFANVCTHMGCSVRWLEWRQQILCPCHGGVYDRWGNLMGGPPARSLTAVPNRLENDTVLVSNRLKEARVSPPRGTMG